MTQPHPTSDATQRHWPLGQLVLARVREFYREPEALFWVYGFPLLMVCALGIAFRNKPAEQIAVDVLEGPAAEATLKALAAQSRFQATVVDEATARSQLRAGKVDLIVEARTGEPPRYEYLFDPDRTEGLLARNAVDDALQRAAGRTDVAEVEDRPINEPGGRYIDFLVPGLVGMSLMGGGLWGVGFVTVDMRIRKLLKRFLATPMRKSHFLLGIMLSRFLFMVPEIFLLLLFSRLAFNVRNYGSTLTVALFVALGAATFSGIGLLVASRAKTLETVSGLMNLVMLPMWVLSGIFFSSQRFPEMAQPLIKLLPLTLLIDGLRSVMQDGASLVSQLPQVLGLAAWGTISFALALRWFRWI